MINHWIEVLCRRILKQAMIDESAMPSERPVSDRRRRELVQAAYRRIAGQGFEGLRTRDVGADAGVNIADP